MTRKWISGGSSQSERLPVVRRERMTREVYREVVRSEGGVRTLDGFRKTRVHDVCYYGALPWGKERPKLAQNLGYPSIYSRISRSWTRSYLLDS